jgi:hypothetical protein
MINYGVVAVCVEALKEKRCNHKHLLTMLLSNLTIAEKACKKLMQMGEALEGLNVRLLVQWFSQAPSLHASRDPKTSAERDPFCYVSNVLANITQTEEARALMMHPERGILEVLLHQVGNRNDVRRSGALRVMRNVCMEPKFHELVLAPESGFYEKVCCMLIGPEISKVDEDDKEGMLPGVRAKIAGGSGLYEPRDFVRTILLDIIILWCQHKASRLYLKDTKMYIIIREYHNWEQSLAPYDMQTEIDEKIEHVVQFLIIDEDDKKPSTATPTPAQITTTTATTTTNTTTTTDKPTSNDTTRPSTSSKTTSTPPAATTSTPTQTPTQTGRDASDEESDEDDGLNGDADGLVDFLDEMALDALDAKGEELQHELDELD